MENNEKKRKYTHRFLAKIVIEATTPLSIGSGEKDIMSDHLVARDINGLPYIPGTAIAGIVRHAIEKNIAEKFFGCNISDAEKAEQSERKKEGKSGGKKGQKESTGEGSQLIFSSAQLVINKKGNVVEGLLLNVFDDLFLGYFKNLPIRQHVRINEKGTTVKGGKFDEEVVYKGTRFCFEIEMLSENTENETVFNDVLSYLASDTLCVGSGTRSGHGEFEIKHCLFASLDLKNNENQRDAYIKKTSSLDDDFWKQSFVIDKTEILQKKDENWTTYLLELKPEDFFLFGSGFGDENADMTPVTEAVVYWESEAEPEINDNCILIPGSSVKGALSHRVAFHYNKIKEVFADDPNVKIEEHTGNNNKAVQTLFGYTTKNEKKTVRGNILISDVIQKRDKEQEKNSKQTKILNHVSIDRFTGGAIDGALFTEEVSYGNDEIYTLTFKVKNGILNDDSIRQAFEAALFDIAKGMLPLGGGTNRGHGCFTGKIFKNKVEI